MFKQFFAGMPFTGLPLFALALFVGLFLVVVLRTFVVQRPRDFESDSALPLDDGKAVTPHEVSS